MQFDAEFVAAVVAHMNDDHDDACLCLVQALGSQPDASSATLTHFNSTALHFKLSVDRKVMTAEVPFPKPIRQESQIRGALVGMSKRARQILVERNR